MDKHEAKAAATATMGAMFIFGLGILGIKLIYDSSPGLLLGMIVGIVVYLVLYGFFRTKFGAKVYDFFSLK